MKNTNCADVAAVFVTYNPNIEHLACSVRAVLHQVADVFVVDNASSNFSPDWLEILPNQSVANFHLLPQSDNFGLGAAHNIGIKQAIGSGAKFVLLLDQDSLVSSGMVERLRSAYVLQSRNDIPIAALGPQYHDADGVELSRFVRVGTFKFAHYGCRDGEAVVDADFLVSSGTLFPVEAIEKVGLMDEELFIDHVDTEWCFRAKARGMRILGVCGATMKHELGEQRVEIRFLRKRIVPFHRPFRYYYMFRNSVLLYKRNYMPLRWKAADMARCFKMAIFFGVISSERLTIIRMMCLGVWDGLIGVAGMRRF